jgi:hypothetical protein
MITTQAHENANVSRFAIADADPKRLYRLAGGSALILLVYSLVTMVLMVTFGGQPKTAQEGFAMLQANRLVGFLRLDGLTILVMPLYYLLFFSLYRVLKKTCGDFAGFASLLVFAGLTLFLASPSVFSWLALSDKFAAATDNITKNQLLAAGEAILASDMWHGSGAILGGILLQTGALLVTLVMLGSKAFGKLTAWLGVAMFGLDLAHLLIAFFFPAGGIILMAIAGTLYLGWFPLVARDFFRLAKDGSKA